MSSINKFTITSPYNYNDMSYDPSPVPNLDNRELSFETHCYIMPLFPNSVPNPAGQLPSLEDLLPPVSFRNIDMNNRYFVPAVPNIVLDVLFKMQEAEDPKNAASNAGLSSTYSSEASPKKRKRGEIQDSDTDLSSTHSSEAPPKKRKRGEIQDSDTDLSSTHSNEAPPKKRIYKQRVSSSHWGVCPQCKTESLLCKQLRTTPICQGCYRSNHKSRPSFRKCGGVCGEKKKLTTWRVHPIDPNKPRVCRPCWDLLKEQIKNQSAMASNEK